MCKRVNVSSDLLFFPRAVRSTLKGEAPRSGANCVYFCWCFPTKTWFCWLVCAFCAQQAGRIYQQFFVQAGLAARRWAVRFCVCAPPPKPETSRARASASQPERLIWPCLELFGHSTVQLRQPTRPPAGAPHTNWGTFRPRLGATARRPPGFEREDKRLQCSIRVRLFDFRCFFVHRRGCALGRFPPRFAVRVLCLQRPLRGTAGGEADPTADRGGGRLEARPLAPPRAHSHTQRTHTRPPALATKLPGKSDLENRSFCFQLFGPDCSKGLSHPSVDPKQQGI